MPEHGLPQPPTLASAAGRPRRRGRIALLVTQQAPGVTAVIGVLVLLGIVAKNSILLVA